MTKALLFGLSAFSSYDMVSAHRFRNLKVKSEVTDNSFSYVAKTFKVPIDHFDNTVSNTALFPMRYLLDEQYYDQTSKNPCILFYAGNEAAITEFWPKTGFITTTLAK